LTRRELEAMILDYLRRENDAAAQARVGGWVALAEADIRQRLRAPWMVRPSFLSLDEIAHPTSFLTAGLQETPFSYCGAEAAYLVDSRGGSELIFLSPSQLEGVLFGGSGPPKYICIEGAYISLFPGSGPARIRFSYYSLGDRIDDLDATNENLTNAPNVYLYSALRHAWLFYGDLEKVSTFDTALSEMVGTINELVSGWNAGPGFRVIRR
jgi:hypothetical protein